ncbi:hypothetical protein [Streptomyces sp. NPDC048650]|uniref:hypothetical protein n=1 Tax=Streptomyces sp. NPDC048650 TaxID=3365583 RepID=UPI003721CBC3
MRLGKPLAVGIAEDPEPCRPRAEERGAGSWEAVEPLDEVPVPATAEPDLPFVGSPAGR